MMMMKSDVQEIRCAFPINPDLIRLVYISKPVIKHLFDNLEGVLVPFRTVQQEDHNLKIA
jgi:hypothetical protein